MDDTTVQTPRAVLFQKARSLGSKAETLEGVIRYLRSHLPQPLHGLQRLADSSLEPARAAERFASRAEYELETHGTRADNFARKCAQTLFGCRGSYTAIPTHFGHLPGSVQARIADQLDELWAGHLGPLLASQWPYRRARSTWAGGKHFIYASVVSNAAYAGGHTERVWSANGKWSGNDSYCTLRFTRRCIDEFGDQVVVGTLVTLDCERVELRTYRATWAEQSRGVDLKMVDGWLVRGYHSTASTLQRALKQAAEARSKAAAMLAMQRAKADGPWLTRIYVTYEDSLSAGNCIPGTRSFVERHGLSTLNQQAIRADALLALEDSSFTRAAIAFAARRHAKRNPSREGAQ